MPMWLDTDIGSDVDDLLALALLASDPAVDLVGVSTVYGDVDLRARLASRVLRLLGSEGVPVHAGAQRPRSGRAVWWAGHEGGGLAGLERETVDPLGGVDALLQAVERHEGQLTVVAIGPLTNLGEALERDPTWPRRVRQLAVMGGEFARGLPEHNLRSDVVAAQQVLACGGEVTFVGLDVTTTVWFDEAHLEQVVGVGGELADLLARQVRGWWKHLGQPRCHPHDPLAALTVLRPELFRFHRSGWRVRQDGDEEGALAPDPDAPPVTHAIAVEVAQAQEEIASRLANAARAGSA